MKHIIEFNLPDDKEDLDIHMKANLYARFYREVYDAVFRPEIRYNGNEAFEKVWEKVAEFIKELED